VALTAETYFLLVDFSQESTDKDVYCIINYNPNLRKDIEAAVFEIIETEFGNAVEEATNRFVLNNE
jgi:hypothetical protein